MRKSRIWPTKRIIFWSVSLTFILWLSCWCFTVLFLGSEEMKPGTFGDMFGSVNALFSGLAFSGVIIAIVLQSQELQLQREELEATRKEFETQNETLKAQRFENTFFQMLSLHHEIISAMTVKIDAATSYTGRRCMQTISHILTHPFKDFNTIEDVESVLASYEKTYDIHGQHLGHYFRNLYNILKFVDSSEISNKKMYSNLLRAQLSNHELLLLAVNCISNHGNEKFKPLIEKYSFLSNLENPPKFVKNAYNSTAFA